MRYRRFGKTGLAVPRISCGAMRFMRSWKDIPFDRIPRESQENAERTVKAAFDAGINHFETARGYGSSEIQLGKAIKRVPRDEIILQTKAFPLADPKEFEALIETSFDRLDVERVDLLALHGLDEKHLPRLQMCAEIVEKWKLQGRVGHLGFSTHAPMGTIRRIIQTGLFEYVNLHYYYIFQDNLPAIELAERYDMGVFIISANDKGGLLYSPSEKLLNLTKPLSPMAFNDLFCLSTPGVRTVSVGAANPFDFKEHINALDHLPATGPAPIAAEIAKRLDNVQREVVGDDWMDADASNLPVWSETPGKINLPVILRLWRLAKALDMLEYAKMRYNILNQGHWFPGKDAGILLDPVDGPRVEKGIIEICSEKHPLFAEKIPEILRKAHSALNT
jgi:predicted aldo/keto reductase-like oxidoreductase